MSSGGEREWGCSMAPLFILIPFSRFFSAQNIPPSPSTWDMFQYLALGDISGPFPDDPVSAPFLHHHDNCLPIAFYERRGPRRPPFRVPSAKVVPFARVQLPRRPF